MFLFIKMESINYFNTHLDIIDTDKELNPKADYIDKCLFGLSDEIDFFNNRANIIISGQTMSGKTNLLHNIIQKKILNKVDINNIYIFSKTAKNKDVTYWPLINYILKNTTVKIWNIYDEIDFNLINLIMKNQEQDLAMNMVLPKDKRKELKKIVIIFDDILGDKELKSYQSDLSNFTTMSRHSNILNIFLTQDYTSIPSKIRRNSNLVFLLTSDNFSEAMMRENTIKNKWQEFQQFYEDNIISTKDYSFLIIDKSAKNDKRYILVKEGWKSCYVKIID